tara:strand:- start:492 stop:1181 length:690 start_codon:yes stop_codon:yes gene_type:complete
MAFGIEATTDSGGFLIDSNTTATEYLTVVSSGTTNAGASVTRQAGDLVFAKPTGTSSSTANRVIYDSVSSSTAVKFLHQVNHVVLRKAQSTTISGSNFGIQIKNASNVIIFDSRSATSGMKVLGGKAQTAYTTAIQPNNSAGVSVTSPTTSFGGVSTIIHSGDPTNVYIACLGGFYQIEASFQLVIGGAYYDYSNNRILGEGYFDLDAFASTTSGIAPFGDILTGELVT